MSETTTRVSHQSSKSVIAEVYVEPSALITVASEASVRSIYLVTFTSAPSGINPAFLARSAPYFINDLWLFSAATNNTLLFLVTFNGNVLFSFLTTVTALAAISLSLALFSSLPTVAKAFSNE